ncbi:MAG TPA: polysaccharide biosynthesis tyrosine autokinase [Patescibacteria group bacterium]|nr:polysaccharide biosynthesis tyrosine autokinase [Patescibacteria group bacterium]
MQDDPSKLARRDTSWADPLAVQAYPSGNGGWASSPMREMHLIDYLIVVRKHMVLALTFLLTLVSVVAVATFKMKPVYVATAQVEIDRASSNLLPFQNGQDQSDWYDPQNYIETQAKVLESDTLALETIKSLKLWTYPEFRSSPKEIAALDSLADLDQQPLERPPILSEFLGRLSVAPIPNSNLLQVSFTSEDPRLAAVVVNKHLQNFIDLNYQTRYESAMRASDWLEQQLADFKSRVEKSEDARLAYERQNQIWTVSEGQNLATQKLSDLSKQLTEAQTERMKDEASYLMVRAGQIGSLPQVQSNTVIQDLTHQQDQLRQAYADAVNKYGPNFPKVKRLRAQLESTAKSVTQEKRAVAQEIVTQYDTAMRREQLIKQALDQQEGSASQQAQKMVQYDILKREADTNQQLYNSLLEKLKEAGLSAGLRSNNVRVVDAAMIPPGPARPQKARDISLAFIVGLVGGVGLAFLREYLDNTVKTPDDVENLTHLPSLAIVPALSGGNAHLASVRMLNNGEANSGRESPHPVALISHEQPQSQIAEAFRALRTSLLLSRADQPPQVILVTSALPKEGKTTAAVNLAITLAQLGDRTLLIDSDLRRPGIGKLLGMNGTFRNGLSSYLAGVSDIEGCTYPYPGVPELSVIPAGPTPPNPADLLSSQRLVDVIEELRHSYKFVVIDSPPIMLATDAVILSTWADGVLLVARSGQTPKGAFSRAQELLASVKCRILGVILNAVNTSGPDYYYRYYPYYGEYYGPDRGKDAGNDSESVT